MSATVLLVDYEPRSITRIRGLLQSLGCQVTLATDGITGMKEFERSRPDLTLVQDLLPRKHGYDVCRELKATPLGKERPIVLMTFVRPGRWRAVRASGCDDYIEKPFDDLTLLDKLGRFLQMGHDARKIDDHVEPDVVAAASSGVSSGDAEEIEDALDEILAQARSEPPENEGGNGTSSAAGGGGPCPGGVAPDGASQAGASEAPARTQMAPTESVPAMDHPAPRAARSGRSRKSRGAKTGRRSRTRAASASASGAPGQSGLELGR